MVTIKLVFVDGRLYTRAKETTDQLFVICSYFVRQLPVSCTNVDVFIPSELL